MKEELEIGKIHSPTETWARGMNTEFTKNANGPLPFEEKCNLFIMREMQIKITLRDTISHLSDLATILNPDKTQPWRSCRKHVVSALDGGVENGIILKRGFW